MNPLLALERRSVRVAGVDIHAVTRAEAAELIVKSNRPSSADRARLVVTPNVNHIRLLRSDPAFASAYREAWLRVADGAPLVALSRLVGTPVPMRVAGSDLLFDVCSAASTAGRSVYFFGGKPGVAQLAVDAAQERWPSLKIAGSMSPSMDFGQASSEVADAVEQINVARPDIVFVCLGAPKQEKFAHAFAADFDADIVIAAGAGIDFLAGTVRRAPQAVQAMGLEWAWRIVQEPRRLARRYLRDAMTFLPIVVFEVLKSRIRLWRR